MTIIDIFMDQAIIAKVQKRLPELFYLAELESSRAAWNYLQRRWMFYRNIHRR